MEFSSRNWYQRHPFNDVNNGPSTRTDARHRVTISAVLQAPWGIQVSPIVLYRSALPLLTFEGIDFNNDFQVNDITPRVRPARMPIPSGVPKNGFATACWS